MEKSTVDTPRPSRRRWRNFALVAIAIVAIYAVVGGVVLPMLAKKLVSQKAGEQLGRVVVLDDLKINPFTLDATAKGFRILEADGKTAFVSFDTLDIAGSATSFYRFAPVADEVTLTGLKVNLVRDGETHYNLSDILARLAAKPAPKADAAKKEEPARFSVSNIRLVNARIDFDDQPKGRKHQVTDINVAVPFVSSLPAHLKEYVQPSFSANVNGAPLKLTGETLPFENSLRTHVALDLNGLDIRRYLEYSPTPLPVKVDSGMLDAKISIRFTQAAGKDPSVDIAGTLGLRELAVSTAENPGLVKVARVDAEITSLDPIIGLAKVASVRVADATGLDGQWTVPSTEVLAVDVDLRKRTARIQSVASRDGVGRITRKADGSLEMPRFAAAPAEATPPAENAPWNVALGKLSLAGYKLTVVDGAAKPAVTYRVAVNQLDVDELTTQDGMKGALAAKLGLDKGGSVDVAASFTLEPLLVNAKIEARRIDLVPLRAYSTQFSTVALKSGAASAKGTLTLKDRKDGMQVAYAGTVEIVNFATFDNSSREDLLNWGSVRTSGIDFQSAPGAPLTLAVAEIVVDKAYSRLVVNPDGKLNVQQLRTATPEDPQATPAPEPPPRNVRIDRITFVDSRLDFTDHFIRPNYAADVGDLQGSVTGLSSDPATRAVVDLKGRYDKSSPVVIAGTVNPLRGDLFLDLSAKGSDIELPKLTAYSQRYAGYGITEGKLTLDVKYHIEGGKLEGRNKILLERLTFGDKVDSPEATKLPVIFAVNLLKDSNGEIQLELPISGSLDDPQFEIGGLITQVLGSLLKKAVTSPFSLIAAAFGGGGGGSGGAAGSTGDAATDGANDLAYVEFAPGLSEIQPAGQKKLDTLTKALQGRPGLTLSMAPRENEESDLRALRLAALRKQIAEARGAKDAPIPDAEYAAAVRQAYAKAKLPLPAGVKSPQEMSVAAMETQMMANVAIGDEELRALGARRVEQVRGYLVGQGHLGAERIQVAAAAAGAEPPAGGPASRVDFALR
jgi:hypothetical protein